MRDSDESGWLTTILGLLLFALYCVGIVALVADDNRYSGKNLAAGVFLPPYSWYVGGKTIYHYFSTSSFHRQVEKRCFSGLQGGGTSKERTELCECMAEKSDIAQEFNKSIAMQCGKEVLGEN